MGKPLENPDHAWAIFSEEGPGLQLDLLIVDAPREDSRHNYPDYVQKKTVILLERIWIVNFCMG